MLNMFIRASIIYVFVLIVIRLMGKRQIGEMQPFEFVITLIIADLACIPMAELAVPLSHGIVPIIVLLILHFFICLIGRKSMKARYIISGRPAILVTPTGINYNELIKLNMNLDDLIESLRNCGVFSIDEVSYAILETNGKMCIIKKAEVLPVSRSDLGIKPLSASLPVTLVMDGRVLRENLELTGVDNKFIEKCLKKTGDNKVKQIMLLTIDNNGKVFYQPKTKPYITFTLDSYSGGKDW
ncbi:MAG: DUF421 domain-containing protein [Clostridia bacterium]